MRIVFFGSSSFSCLVLGALLDGRHEIAAVVTQPDQPKGRRMQLCPTVLCQEAAARQLLVYKPERLRGNAGFLAEVADLRPDALLVASYGQIIPQAFLKLTRWPLNVHPSQLPELRGASPIRTALLQGLSQTGCCIMRMTPRLDDGDVLIRETVEVGAEWNHDRAEYELGLRGGILARRALDLCEAGAGQFEPQDHLRATYTRLFGREDTILDWTQPAETVYNFVRAWDPDVGALTSLPDGRRLKVWRVSIDPPEQPATLMRGAPTTPGTVQEVEKAAIWVATGTRAIRLEEVQPESKPRMSCASFLAGNKLEPGMVLGQTNSGYPRL